MTARALFPALALSMLTGATWGCNRSRPAPLPPQITVDEATYDFGRVPQGTKVTHAYILRNRGALPLMIDNARAACDCTVALPARRLLPPGNAAAIEVVLDTSREQGRTPHSITVYSNDPAQPVTMLTLVGDVEAVIAAEPPELYVGHVRRGQQAPSGVRLVTADAGVLRAVESHGPVVDARLRTSAEGGQVVVTIKPDAPAGRFKDTVTVQTNSRQQPVVTIPVVGIVDTERRS